MHLSMNSTSDRFSNTLGQGHDLPSQVVTTAFCVRSPELPPPGMTLALPAVMETVATPTQEHCAERTSARHPGGPPHSCEDLERFVPVATLLAIASAVLIVAWGHWW